MAAWHYVTLSTEQRETLVSMAETTATRTDNYGNTVRMEITNWKNKRLYINTSINGKRDESLWISLEDANDVKMQFNGDSNWLILEALLNEEIARNTPVIEAEETPAEEAAPRELTAFEKILAGAKFQTVAEIAPEAIEYAEKIREIEKQAAKAAEWFAGQHWQKVVIEGELAQINTEHMLNRRAYHDAYQAEYVRLLKKAGL